MGPMPNHSDDLAYETAWDRWLRRCAHLAVERSIDVQRVSVWWQDSAGPTTYGGYGHLYKGI